MCYNADYKYFAIIHILPKLAREGVFRLHLIVKDREFYKNVAGISIPIALQGLITVGVNLLDTMMLGQLGETAISGSALANQFIGVFQILCMGMGMGASVLTARYWGMKDGKSLKKSITIMYRFCLGLALLFTVLTALLPAGIMSLYTNETGVLELGVTYFRYSLPTYLLMGFSLTTTLVLRSVGQVKLPLISSIGAFFLNVFFNYCLIFGNFGFPQLEVAGAAIATVMARVLEFALICGYFWFVDKKVAYRLRDFLMKCGDLVKEYFRISFPVLVSDGLLAFGNSVVTSVIGHMGESFVSANSITVVTQQLSSVLVQGVSQASAIVTGHTLGRGEVEKARHQGEAFLGIGMALGLLAGGIIMVLSEPMISAYNLTQETIAIARELMVAISIIIFFQAMNSILTKGVLRGGGDTKFLMLGDILFLWVASIPLGALAGFVWHLPAFWVYTLLKCDQIIKAVWCIFRLRSGKWIKKIS